MVQGVIIVLKLDGWLFYFNLNKEQTQHFSLNFFVLFYIFTEFHLKMALKVAEK